MGGDKQSLRELCTTDLHRYRGVVSKKLLYHAIVTKHPGFRFTYVMRHAACYPKYSFRGIVFRLLYKRFSNKYGFQIPYDTPIGKGLYIGHRGCIVVSPEVKIGEFCNMTHGVTIGKTYGKYTCGTPKIGNRVWIGTGAVIVGNVIIGDDVLIAPNSFVNFSVPSHSIVKGNPGKVASVYCATSDYIVNTGE